MNKNVPMIVCPHCGREYLPVEIFMAESVFPDPGEVFRTQGGRIDFYSGSDMDFEEEWVCECGTPLKITMNMSFKVEANQELNFDDDYESVITLEDKQIILEEDLF